MKKNYLLPRQNVVEIDEEEMLCISDGTKAKSMRVELNDYGTYEDTPRNAASGLNWDGVGTGSDF